LQLSIVIEINNLPSPLRAGVTRKHLPDKMKKLIARDTEIQKGKKHMVRKLCVLCDLCNQLLT